MCRSTQIAADVTPHCAEKVPSRQASKMVLVKNDGFPVIHSGGISHVGQKSLGVMKMEGREPKV